MNHAARRTQRLLNLKRLGWAYCALVCAAGTIGGLLGMIQRENDTT